MHLSAQILHFAYLISAVLFILGIKGMTHPRTARQGNLLASLGMFIAIVGTLLHEKVVRYEWIILGFVVGSLIGSAMAIFMPMTRMPERIALSHSFGGLAAGLVGVSEYYLHGQSMSAGRIAPIGFEVLFGMMTFTGSLMAFGKLAELIPSVPITYRFQNPSNIFLFLVTLGIWIYLIFSPQSAHLFYTMVALGLLVGILIVLPIGGADMPVVICLLNSYAGLAASATGFVLDNNVLIISGALDGGSGFILAMLMSKAMNRSFRNVLFGAFGAISEESSAKKDDFYAGKIKSTTPEEVALLLENSRLVMIAPGYGLAVSQAQHVLGELVKYLKGKGVEVKFAIHPVAGRMPGHMNVLLAEAEIPYEDLLDLEPSNQLLPEADLCIVVGANDVVNPLAREDKNSPIYGMPILDVDRARTVVVIKRSLSPGFAGIPNPLFIRDNTLMLFEDAKKGIQAILAALKGATLGHGV
jgi:NAD(P) transhydrogenase subunit beta